jgi:2-octaprenyl-6-methoxyphenol hydroxylase
MKVCIVGGGLISLVLAKALVNKGIYVDIYLNQKFKSPNKSRTLGISKDNIQYLNKNILNVEKILWKINKIEIYNKNLKNEKVLNFENNEDQLFSIIKNQDLHTILIKKLNRTKFFKYKKNIQKKDLHNKDYNLFINCDPNNFITKKFFYKQMNKKYNSHAHTLIIKHKSILNNNTAVQIFTNMGPMAFLPVSNKETSVVYSVKGNKNVDLTNLIKKYNMKYSITQISESCSFELKSSNLRYQHHNNILAFGELLHKLHPLAGQGFNMSLRDIKVLMDLIKFKIDHGLELDKSVCLDFEKKTRHKNYLFSNSIDFIYEFFKLENKINNPILSKSIQYLGKNKLVNEFFIKFADKGILI